MCRRFSSKQARSDEPTSGRRDTGRGAHLREYESSYLISHSDFESISRLSAIRRLTSKEIPSESLLNHDSWKRAGSVLNSRGRGGRTTAIILSSPWNNTEMKVLIAGATGAIGTPLLSYLDEAGHQLFALVRSLKAAGTREATRAHEVVADALDAASVLDVVQHTKPDVIVNELTSLPKHYTPEEMKAAAVRDKEVRMKGNANLLAAARAANCRRYVLDLPAFWYAPGPGLADENASFAFDASPGIAAGCRDYADLEAAAKNPG